MILLPFLLGADEGPILNIMFSQPESNGSCMELRLPFKKAIPKHVETGEKLCPNQLKEKQKILCYYEHHKSHYEAIILKITGKRKQKGFSYLFSFFKKSIL